MTYLDDKVPDVIDPESICCANCEAFVPLSRTNAKIGACMRSPPTPVVLRYIITTIPEVPIAGMKQQQILDGRTDSAVPTVAAHRRCWAPDGWGFVRKHTNGTLGLGLPPVDTVGETSELEDQALPGEKRPAVEEKPN